MTGTNQRDRLTSGLQQTNNPLTESYEIHMHFDSGNLTLTAWEELPDVVLTSNHFSWDQGPPFNQARQLFRERVGRFKPNQSRTGRCVVS